VATGAILTVKLIKVGDLRRRYPPVGFFRFPR